AEYQQAYTELISGIQWQDNERVIAGTKAVAKIQEKYGASVMPSKLAVRSELILNQTEPFKVVIFPYLAAFLILFGGYFYSLARHKGAKFRFRHPLYFIGSMVFLISILIHLLGYLMRWIASGRAPLSNGYESLIFISLMVGIVGFYYELRDRRGSVGGLGALLTLVILGIAMLPTFDPAISPLVPVLASVWLIIHVTIITASYGFLSLAALMSMTMLILHWFKGPNRKTLRAAILNMSQLHWSVMIAGLAFLSVGTFLGGVWANESWGRYWGWDPKETWALVTILVYAFVVHLRFIDKTNKPLLIAAGSFISISSVIMTYFGVNYFLSGLHSYAEGDVSSVPSWVYLGAIAMLLIVFISFIRDKTRHWDEIAEG
ncbi:MAG: cytochrome c biogenesis protein CcsA, partial [Candidatus Eisenbacteria bacterium]|nr:cytochrome c biogenesis protein CcsA [Candidatus Eisenbacteria bacterium]